MISILLTWNLLRQATGMAESKSRTSNFFCRICHDDGDLISPCHCTGSVGLLHLSCLEKWLSTNGSQSCELCNYEFQVTCQTKPLTEVNNYSLKFESLGSQSFFALLFQWFKELKKDPIERRYVFCDLASFIILTPMLVFSFVLCVLGACHYLDLGSLSEAKSLFFLCTLLLLIYILWICLLFKHNYAQFQAWKNKNMDIKLTTIIKEQV